ncbi:uncharacterized protein LOC130815604 [Amaranthus tricolor]|uniref:uncharacterized protein LOC130815604 n=1 Tax=Amaranthus tricolor TaxID=29722 RepID=UPI002585807B|nr:uncharacterized protein LOC130815604 [Amaranthus tricolor]
MRRTSSPETREHQNQMAPERPKRLLIYRIKFPNKMEETNHYSLIPNNKENNVDLNIQGHPTNLDSLEGEISVVLKHRLLKGTRLDHAVYVIVQVSLEARGISSVYIEAIWNMYDRVSTNIQTPVGITESFPVKVGLHHGSALSPLIFTVIMEKISKSI